MNIFKLELAVFDEPIRINPNTSTAYAMCAKDLGFTALACDVVHQSANYILNEY